jgi:hypothetical protein
MDFLTEDAPMKGKEFADRLLIYGKRGAHFPGRCV